MVHTHTHPHRISAAQGDSLSSKWVLALCNCVWMGVDICCGFIFSDGTGMLESRELIEPRSK